MKLEYVSITGADDNVNITDLNAIYEKYPFVEWAILLLPEQTGTKRFPSENWITDFKTHYKGQHKAMHLCGSAFLGFVEHNPEIMKLMNGFKRIQLNLEFGDITDKYDQNALITRIKDHPEFEFIIQYNDKNNDILPLLRDIPNHALLFDTSAGRGMAPESWPAPVEGHRCGYAGGITPENTQKNINLIAQVTGDYKTWVDMESGVRTDNNFDLEKVRQVLETASAQTIKAAILQNSAHI